MADGTPPAGGRDEVAAAVRRLEERGEPYVRATVVRREPPVSATVGDRAVVTADGTIHGWIGGVECAQTAVVEEARRALEAGEARLVGLAPEPADIERPGLVARRMTCHGGGTLEVFLEPVAPGPELLLVGNTAVSRAVGRFAAEVGFAVTVVDPSGGDHPYAASRVGSADLTELGDAVGESPFVVIASMGQADTTGLVAAVELAAAYIGLVANERRAATVIGAAADRLGIDPDDLRDAVAVPAGVAIDARTPDEIGISIAAELVRVRRTDRRPAALELGAAGAEPPSETARDPVCGMAVAVATAAATVVHDGETYHFCSPGCAEAFEGAPAEYLADA